MAVTTAELVRRFRDDAAAVAAEDAARWWSRRPPRAARRTSSTGRCGRRRLRALLGDDYDPARVYVGVQRRGLAARPQRLPVDRRTTCWRGRGSLAYQGVTLSLANFDAARPRAAACARSSSRRSSSACRSRGSSTRRGGVRVVRRLAARPPAAGARWCGRSSSSASGARRSVSATTSSCGSTRCRRSAAFPTSGATEDSTLGYALGARGVLMARDAAAGAGGPAGDDREDGPAERALVQGRARRRRLPVARRGGAAPTAFNLAQLARHVGNKVVEWPIAAVVYPVVGFLGWHLAYRFADHPVLFVLGIAFPSISLGLTIWVGGIVTQDLIESLTPYCPRPVDVRPHDAAARSSGAPSAARRTGCSPRAAPGACCWRWSRTRPLRARQDRPRDAG